MLLTSHSSSLHFQLRRQVYLTPRHSPSLLSQRQCQVYLAHPHSTSFPPLLFQLWHQLYLIRASGARLLTLVNDVLDAAAMRQGRLVLKQERVLISNLVRWLPGREGLQLVAFLIGFAMIYRV